ncbi:hypothetical protein IF1G_10951 [Cordyceps javanica]|uniref:Uncharacterized protein n=1 Tax=Cordyceps javanica TaxID=43265 RepID=A0A545ULH1_9HYPO|nr:hypothetical protein IF1G_10951 [Cordyceps javanica]
MQRSAEKDGQTLASYLDGMAAGPRRQWTVGPAPRWRSLEVSEFENVTRNLFHVGGLIIFAATMNGKAADKVESDQVVK